MTAVTAPRRWSSRACSRSRRAARARAADDATAQARSHYEMGLKLFDAREHEQALIEFSKANEIKPRPAALFMMAQCEYLMGRLKDASIHYQRYATENPDGEFAELARDRVESIDKRPSTFVVNTRPRGRHGPHLARGRDRARSSPAARRPTTSRSRAAATASTSPSRTTRGRRASSTSTSARPSRCSSSWTRSRRAWRSRRAPPGATLYVNGNRARNPYRQDVTPGHIEIFAEATDYDAKTVDLTLAPGERKLLTGDARLRLNYVQRSGRPELVVASSLLGGIVGAGAVAAAHRRRAARARTSRRCCWWAAAAFRAPSRARWSDGADRRGTSPTTRRSSSWAGCGSATAEGLMGGVIVRQVMTAQGDVMTALPGPDPCRGPIGDQLRAGVRRQPARPGARPDRRRADREAARRPTGACADPERRAGRGIFAGALRRSRFKWKPYGSSWEYTVQPTVTPATTSADDIADERRIA